ILQQITRFSSPPAYAAARPGDVRDSLADTTEAEQALGYRTLVGFPVGLRATVQWYKREIANPAPATVGSTSLPTTTGIRCSSPALPFPSASVISAHFAAVCLVAPFTFENGSSSLTTVLPAICDSQIVLF